MQHCRSNHESDRNWEKCERGLYAISENVSRRLPRFYRRKLPDWEVFRKVAICHKAFTHIELRHNNGIDHSQSSAELTRRRFAMPLRVHMWYRLSIFHHQRVQRRQDE